MKLIAAACLVMFAQASSADQIENEAKDLAPQGVLVKVDPATKTVEIFAAPTLAETVRENTASADSMESAIRNTETTLNKIGEFKLSKNELDKDSSTDAWYYRWYGSSWRWNNWGGYRPYYYNWNQPYYYAGNFNYGYYNYSYRYNYGYNNCYYGWYY